VAAGLCLVGALSWLGVDPSRQLRVSLADVGTVQIQSSKYISDQSANRSPVVRASS
jgi:hypothetical protein